MELYTMEHYGIIIKIKKRVEFSYLLHVLV